MNDRGKLVFSEEVGGSGAGKESHNHTRYSERRR